MSLELGLSHQTPVLFLNKLQQICCLDSFQAPVCRDPALSHLAYGRLRDAHPRLRVKQHRSPSKLEAEVDEVFRVHVYGRRNYRMGRTDELGK